MRSRSASLRLGLAGVVAALALACSGQIGAAGGGSDESPGAGAAPGASARGPGAGPGAAAPGASAPAEGLAPGLGATPAAPEAGRCTVDVGPTPLRALAPLEYANTIRDLFADPGQAAPTLVGEVSPALAEQQLQAAEQIARRAAADLPRLMGCDPATGGAACARRFVTEVGARAFRRPLASDEIALYEGLYARTRAGADDRTAAELVLQALLQSPFFLYRPEIGVAPRAGETVAPLTQFELASRLSYLFTDSMPDAELLAAVRAAALRTAEDVAREARRLLANPQARAVLARFFEQWLDFGRIETLQKAAAPGYTPALRGFMREETRLFLDHVFFHAPASDLFSASYSFANRALATFLGAAGPAGAAFERVSLDPGRRLGVLTHASLMAANAEANQTHPVLRGKLVRTRILCEPLPDTPPGLEVKVPELQPGQSARQRWGRHSSDAACSACHRLMDPVGFGFENYSAVGAWRDQDLGAPVDATGEVLGSDVAGPFVGGVGLARKLAGSAQARACVATQWFRFAAERLETDRDACTLAVLGAELGRPGTRPLDMLVAFAASPAFASRRVAP
jgi:hypothetical protein